jgi:hypothetical protein
MPKKIPPGKPSEMPTPKKFPEVEPPFDPEGPAIPQEDPDIIPDEGSFENPPPFEILLIIKNENTFIYIDLFCCPYRF